MAIANMTRDMIFARMRQLIGVTDSSKGGPLDSDLYATLDGSLQMFVLAAGALETVIKLSTVQNDKYLPMTSEILWSKTCNFLDSTGKAYPLDLVDVAPRPGSIGDRPRVFWLTAVNVPDAAGKSSRTLGIDPAVNYNGTNNVILEAFQLPQDLSGASDYPELSAAIQRYIPYAFALDVLPMFPDKIKHLEGYLTRARSRGIDAFRKLCRPAAKMSHGGKDVMRYKLRSRARF